MPNHECPDRCTPIDDRFADFRRCGGSKDIREKNNLAGKFPERAQTMKMAIEAWKEDVAWKTEEHIQ